jgi:capsular exopolysaccharide synthesis family protein
VATTSDKLDLLQIVWRRKLLIAVCLVIGLAAGGLFYVLSTPCYQSDAQVLVVKKRPEVVTGANPALTQFDDYMATQRILIRCPLVVERAIRLGNLRGLQTFAGEAGDLTQTVIKSLSVGPASQDASAASTVPTNVLSLSFRGPVAAECAPIVNAILDSYCGFLDETFRSMSNDTVKLIAEARRVLQDDLEKREAAYRAFREKAPLLWKGNEEINPLQDRLTQIETQRSALLLRKTELESQLKTVENARRAGNSPNELVALISSLSARENNVEANRNAPTTVRNEALPLLLEERALSADYGRNHPQVQALRQRIEAIRGYSILPASAYVAQPKFGATDSAMQPPDYVQAYLQYLNQEHARVLIEEETLAKLFEYQHDMARKLNSYQIQDAEFRNGIARTEVLYDGLVKRLQEAGLVKDYGGYEARVIAPAGVGTRVSFSLLSIFQTSLLLSLLGGVGLAYVAESADKSFRTLAEIQRRLGLPVMACIPRVGSAEARRANRKAAAGGTFDPLLITHYRPKSAAAESYRRVRTALYFGSSIAAGHKVVQFTSSAPRDGKSTVAANMAVSIAQSGKRTLLIDADLRKPRVHEIFALAAPRGLTSVISGEAEYADAIQDISIPHLSILPCGPLPASPAELLTSPRFAELLRLFREQYDYVLLDSPPVLAETDASVVAHHVDGVVLVVRASKNGRPMAERTRNILHDLGAKILGVVVNAVEKNGASSYEYETGYGRAGSEDVDQVNSPHGEFTQLLH